MRGTAKEERIRKILGDPAKIDRELQCFEKSTHALSSNQPRMIDLYLKRWVVLYDGDVRADAGTFEEAMASVSRLKLPRENVLVRFIEKNQRTLIL